MFGCCHDVPVCLLCLFFVFFFGNLNGDFVKKRSAFGGENSSFVSVFVSLFNQLRFLKLLKNVTND